MALTPSGGTVTVTTVETDEGEAKMLVRTQQPISSLGTSTARNYGSIKHSQETFTDGTDDRNIDQAVAGSGISGIQYRGCCESTTRCCCLPCCMAGAICSGLCGCYKYDETVSNRRLETTRRTLRAGSKNLPRVVPIIRCVSCRCRRF